LKFDESFFGGSTKETLFIESVLNEATTTQPPLEIANGLVTLASS
jgi:hypothetical protein